VDLETKDMDEFLIKCLKKKLKYLFLTHLPLVNKTFIINFVLVFPLWFFINVWKGRSKKDVKKYKALLCNFLWEGGQLTIRVRVQRDDVVASYLMVGGLGITNLKEALVTSLCKWVMYALELGNSNFKTLFKYNLNYCVFKTQKVGTQHSMGFCPYFYLN
jgi:hypothetical protein